MIIGLTGPTGAGKGQVTRLLREAGIPVVETDKLAREVTTLGHPCLAELAAVFSSSILQKDGTLNRAALARVAFASPEATARLNAVTHPYITALVEQELADFWDMGVLIAAVDAPLLFEAGLDSLCDCTVAVLAPAATRRARICARDGITEEQASQRMNAQPGDQYYEERADEVLRNDGDLAAFGDKVTLWIRRLKETKV